MKKGYVHFVPPIIALVVFAFVYMGFRKTNEAQVQARDEKRMTDAKKKKDDAQAALLKAYDEANAQVETRKKQKEADDAKKEKEAKEFADSVNARNMAKQDAVDLTQRANGLEKDKEILAKEVEALAADKKAAELEQVHMRKLVQDAQANATAINASLKKIQESRDAWVARAAEARKQAAAAAAGK